MIAAECGFKTVNGIDLYYEMYGSGQPLVLIHGGGGSIRHDYWKIIERLSSDCRLIGVDLKNHGKSGHRSVPQTFEQDARDVAALLDALEIEKASFMGFSNGGNTVMQIAHLFPEKTERMVVASAFYKRSGMMAGFFEGMNMVTIDHMPQSLKDNFLMLTPDQSLLQNMFEKDSLRMIHFQDWDESVLRSIAAPTLFISGDHDVMTPEHAVEMWRLVPNSRLLILPSTHGAYMMADENGHLNESLVNLTIQQIRNFIITVT